MSDAVRDVIKTLFFMFRILLFSSSRGAATYFKCGVIGSMKSRKAIVDLSSILNVQEFWRVCNSNLLSTTLIVRCLLER